MSCESIKVTSLNPSDCLIETAKLRTIPKGRWKGIDHGDNRYRLITSYISDARLSKKSKGSKKSSKGRLMNSFNRKRLLRIAWEMGVSNPDGFSRIDCEFFDVDLNQGFAFFASAWHNMFKQSICNYIWNHLDETDEIIAL